MIKYSRQREAIKQYLSGTTCHPTAEQVYQQVREDYPNISLGTVYRNLSLLTELGEIQKIPSQDGLDHFDARITPHAHIYCTRCHRIDDLPGELPDTLDKLAQQHYSGQIQGHSITFHGICKDCMNIKEGN